MSRSIPAVVLIACAVAAATAPAAPVPNPVPTDEQGRLRARGKRFAERGQIDLFVACATRWKVKADDRRLWEPAADLGRRLIEKAEMPGGRVPQDTPSSYKDFAAFVDRWKPEFTRRDEAYFRPDPDEAPAPVPYEEVIQAPGVVSPVGVAHCLILSQGSVQAGRGIQHSVVFANGDVAARTNMNSVVIVCDGDVTSAEGQITSSVVVARGNITAKSAATVVVMAGGKVALENKDALKRKGFGVISENAPNTLGIKFFELSSVGLEVKAADKAVTVEKVAAKSEAEKAGVKAGDVILEVGEKKPADAESLRRLLRDALAVGDATVKVKRGNDTLSVTLKLSD